MIKPYLCVPNEDNSFYDLNLNHDLSPELIFVFGSNLAGRHGKGAAKEAALEFGAIYGQGVGLMNRSYAIPTKDNKLKILSLSDIKSHVEIFEKFSHDSGLYFYVTPIGTGLAGYKHSDIAPLFKNVKNCWLPLQWREFILSEKEIKQRLNRKNNICPKLSIHRNL